MSDLLDSSWEDSPAGKVRDFGRGLVHAAIENPVNGILQITNRSGVTNLPELDIVDNPKSKTAGTAGEIAGGVAVFFAMSVAGRKMMGNIGGSGIGGTMLRAGITGAVFEGVLKPSDSSSNSFALDRVSNGLVGAATFSSMAAAGYGLDRTGLFAVPEARSLMGSVGYGAVTGLAGGFAHAQSDAMINQGRLVAPLSQYANDMGSFAAFGGAFGALGYGAEKLAQHRRGGPVEIQSENASVKVWTDAKGEPVKVQTVTPSVTHRGYEIKVTNTKMTTGNWSQSSGARFEGGRTFWMDAQEYSIRDIKLDPANNQVRITDDGGVIRQFEPRKYVRTSEGEIARIARETANAEAFARRVLEIGTRRTLFDKSGRLESFTDSATNQRTGAIFDDKTGAVRHLSLRGENGELTMVRKDGNSWTVYADQANRPNAVNSSVRAGSSQFEWKGEITHSHGQVKTDPWKFEFKPENGKPMEFGSANVRTSLMENIMAQSQFVPGGSGRPFVTIDQSGRIFVNSSSGHNSGFVRPMINGEAAGSGPVQIKPGDSLVLRTDVGDRYPVWENFQIDWSRDLAGKLRLGGYEMRPGTTFDLYVPGK